MITRTEEHPSTSAWPNHSVLAANFKKKGICGHIMALLVRFAYEIMKKNVFINLLFFVKYSHEDKSYSCSKSKSRGHWRLCQDICWGCVIQEKKGYLLKRNALINAASLKVRKVIQKKKRMDFIYLYLKGSRILNCYFKNWKSKSQAWQNSTHMPDINAVALL